MDSALATKKNNDDENTFRVGELVTVKTETHGIKDKCLLPENFDKTITPMDNVMVPDGCVGIVLGFLGIGHTCMVIVCFGGILGGQKLALSENKLKKATPGPK